MENINSIPENIENHLKGLLSMTDDTELTLDDLKNVWIEKENLFERQTRSLGMVPLDQFAPDDPRGAILLTYSGSLISIYSAEDNFRKIEYASIKMRRDVPDVVIMEKTSLNEPVKINSPVSFSQGDIKKTSAVYKILSFEKDVPRQDQDKRISEAVIFLTNGFVKINRTLPTAADEQSPDQFDTRSIVKYIADTNNLTQKQVKEILEDYISILKSGLILSGRVSLGNIGNLYTKVQKPQSARVMKVPSTGEEIMVNAKPEMYVPKISFSKKLKQEISEIEVLN